MQDSGAPYKFTYIWGQNAGSGYVTDPIPATTASSVAASQSLGFPPGTMGATGTPPAGADLNGILQYLASWAQWLQAGAPLFYDSTFSTAIGGYPKGAMLLASGATNWWFSTADNNTSDPDTGGANWIYVPIVAGFPVSAPAVSISGTISPNQTGAYVQVSGSSTTQTIASSGWSVGAPIGFFALAACTVAIAGGATFQGGALSGDTSVSLATGQFICAAWNGTSWAIFDASPELLHPSPSQMAYYTAALASSFVPANNTTYTMATISLTCPAYSTTGAFRFRIRMVELMSTGAANAYNSFAMSVTDGTNTYTSATFEAVVTTGTSNGYEASLTTNPTYAQNANVTLTFKIACGNGSSGAWSVLSGSTYFEVFVEEA